MRRSPTHFAFSIPYGTSCTIPGLRLSLKAELLVAAFNLETAAVDLVPPDFDADRFLDESWELALAPSFRC